MTKPTDRPAHRETPKELERSIVGKLARAGLLTLEQLADLGLLPTDEGEDTEVSADIMALYDEGEFDLGMLGEMGWKITAEQVTQAGLTPTEERTLTLQSCLDTGSGEIELGSKLEGVGGGGNVLSIIAEIERRAVTRGAVQDAVSEAGLGEGEDALPVIGGLFGGKTSVGDSGRDN